jgi:hypothetical protein
MQIPLGAGSYVSPHLPFSAQRCINLYKVVAQEQSLNGTALFLTPGIVSFGDLGDYGSRGAHKMGGVLYTVNKTTLYSIDENGNETSIGTVLGAVRCSFADNGDKLCIVAPGGNAYVYTASTDTFAQITDPDYTTADSVCYKDGYYIFTQSDGEFWFCSALNDPSDIDALDYDGAELSPDKIVSCHASYDEVYILGEWTIQAFQNIGGSSFPFQNIPGASLEKGCHAKYSPIQWEGYFYFVGGGINEQSGIYRTSGANEPERISTDAIETEIQKFTSEEIAESFSYTFSLRGYSFVCFTFKSNAIKSKTFCFNVTATKLLGALTWNELQSGVTDNYWDVASVDKIYNKLVISRISDGKLGYLDVNTYTEFSDVIRRVSITPNLSPGTENYFVSRIELSTDSGQGLISGQGSDPMVMMRFSDNGGRTWSNELWRQSGKIGGYQRRTRWNRLGFTPHYRCFEFSMTDPVDGAWIRLDVN